MINSGVAFQSAVGTRAIAAMLAPMKRIPALVLLVCAACGSGKAANQAAPAATTEVPTTTTIATLPPTTAPPTTAAPPSPAPLGVSCPPAMARAEPRADRPVYDLKVDVRPDDNTVSGTVAVHFTPDLPTDRLVFRLWGNAPDVSNAGSKLQPGPVTINGQPAAAQQPDATTLVVPHAVAANKPVDISLPWQLTLPGANRDRIARVGDNVRLGSFFPILAWEPGVGWATEGPTRAHGETAMTPAANFTAHVTVPPG